MGRIPCSHVWKRGGEQDGKEGFDHYRLTIFTGRTWKTSTVETGASAGNRCSDVRGKEKKRKAVCGGGGGDEKKI